MSEKEEFLLSDFNQYHEWMRHYDKSFTSMINFLYSGYAAIITASYVLYSKYPTIPEASLGATILLSFAALVSPVFIYWLMKKRKYFADTARWVNKIRAAYLTGKPLGIDTPADVGQHEKYPPYFNKSSTHIILLFFTSLCSAALLSLAIYSYCITLKKYFLNTTEISLLWFLVIALIAFFGYSMWIIRHLKGKEKSGE